MTAHVRRPASTSSATEVNRVVNATAFDLNESAPPPLVNLKRVVNEFDLLEVSDQGAWTTAVSSLEVRWQRLFSMSRFDRVRYRHQVYGYQLSAVLALTSSLETALLDPDLLDVIGALFRGPAVNSGSGLSLTLRNVMTVNHASTIIDARKPVIGTAANGIPILTCSTSCLQVPLHSDINTTATWWISFFIRLTSAAGNPVPFSIDSAGSGGASARKLVAIRAGGDLLQVFNSSSTSARNCNPGTIWTLNTWVHCLYELRLGKESSPGVPAPEAQRCVIRKDGIAQVVTFSDGVGTPGVLATSMAQPAGFFNLLAQGAVAGGNGIVGQVGGPIIIGKDAMPGAVCCLTDDAALALSQFERPT